MKFGKKPARPDAVKLKFSQVVNAINLPVPPPSFGHQGLIGEKWGIFGNDDYGDCVWAGAAHEHMLWTREGGTRVTFTKEDVLADYAAVTGFNPKDPDTDQGTDMQLAAAYRQKTGIVDSMNRRHTIDAYAALKAGDVDQLALAVWLFGAAGVGVNCPSSMMKQFDNNEPWNIVPGDTVDDGHYIPCVGRDEDGNFTFVSWGQLQMATPEWVAKYMDEGIAYLSMEIIIPVSKVSPEGFNPEVLVKYLKGIA